VQSDVESLSHSIDALTGDHRIDVICDTFEREWRSGKQPALSTYLQLCPEDERRRLFTELLAVESELRSRDGTEISWNDYLVSYPEFADCVETSRFRHQSFRVDDTVVAKDQLPQQLDQFALLECVGSGSSSAVWKARDTRLNRVVAIKIPHNRNLSGRELGRFLHEARAIAQLKHAGIVPVHDVVRKDNFAYIVSDFIEGEDLAAWLRHSQPSPATAATLCKQICEALGHAHAQGIVHRDLKPANVLLDAQQQPHIADFGLAKQLSIQSSLSQDNKLLGTPAYMAPEQAGGSGNVDCRSDVYALGVILYEMLTGFRPHEGNFDEVIRAVISTEPERPRSLKSDIPREIEWICQKALRKAPEERYQTATEMVEELEHFLKGEPLRSRRFRHLRVATKVIKRREFIVAASAAVVGGFAANRWFRRTTTLAATSQPMPRVVRLTTKPDNAHITFIPLSETTGEPIVDRIVRAGRSPVEVELLSGDYLVEAVLDGNRFHEVLRHVPNLGEWVSDNQKHRQYSDLGNQVVGLPDIKIPGAEVLTSMTLVNLPPRDDSDLNAPILNLPPVPSPFYVDRNQATVEDYLWAQTNPPSYFGRFNQVSNRPVTLTFDDAVAFAEAVGKRLPTGVEWDASQGLLTERTTKDLAEWTTDCVLSPLSRPQNQLRVDQGLYGETRIARGGSSRLIDGEKDLEIADCAPTNWIVVERPRVHPAIGVRCVRNLNPRFYSRDSSA
jgi:serine/threonine protein kinase